MSTCPACSSAFDLTHLLDWTYRGRPAPMHPAYLAELALIQDRAGLPRTDLTAGVKAVAPVPVGSTVVITGSDGYAGLTGVVERRARTRYHLRTARGRLTVPVNRVAPLEER